MGIWNSRGLRGSTLEDMINHTNDLYREKKLALIQKIPTPITPVSIDKTSRHITLAYFDQKSTVDYIGAIQGVPVCFDAKECAADTFPLQNVHPHQVAFMREFVEQGGIAFFNYIFFHRGMNFTTCHFSIWTHTGSGCSRADERVLHMRKWIKRGASKATGIY